MVTGTLRRKWTHILDCRIRRTREDANNELVADEGMKIKVYVQD